jgi:hypothetical protein
MARCKHPKIRIIEEATWSSEHYRDMDGTWTHNNLPGDYTGMVEVYCSHCGFRRRYGNTNRPKWLRQYIDEYWDVALEVLADDECEN